MILTVAAKHSLRIGHLIVSGLWATKSSSRERGVCSRVRGSRENNSEAPPIIMNNFENFNFQKKTTQIFRFFVHKM